MFNKIEWSSPLQDVCHSFYDINHTFDNQKWRSFLNGICQILNAEGHQVECISPFGFELTKNKNFLKGSLRKFYCYLGTPKATPQERDLIASQFKKVLFQQLHDQSPGFYNDIILVIENDLFTKLKPANYSCRSEDKLIDIQVRSTENILVDYAEYIIANINGLIEQKGESNFFYTRTINRSRTFQLYIMLESIFDGLVKPLDIEELNIYGSSFKYINSKLNQFYDNSIMATPVTQAEAEIYENLIVNRLKLIKQAISQNDSSRNIVCKAFHTPTTLQLVIDEKPYKIAINKIISTYQGFI